MGRSATLQGAKIAVVEDDACVRDALALYLGARDYRVTTFGSAEEALASGALHEFGALIRDFRLPGEDGLSLLRRARRASSTQLTVLISGTDQSEIPPHLRRGVDALLRKPLSGEDVCTALARLTQPAAPESVGSSDEP